MTKEREALKLVLDVLVEINKLSIGENAICLPAEIDTAMDAAKEVLAQPEPPPECQTEAEKKAFAFGWWKAMEAQRLAQTKQEPVAWKYFDEAYARACNSSQPQEVDGGDLLDGIEKLRALRDSEWAQSRDIDGEIRASRGHDDQTTPPQRTWVGLTDEDKQTAFDETQEGGGFWEFADAIEAKLKEKNLETRTGAT